jgi:hypothetical protein
MKNEDEVKLVAGTEVKLIRISIQFTRGESELPTFPLSHFVPIHKAESGAVHGRFVGFQKCHAASVVADTSCSSCPIDVLSQD